GEGVGAVIAGGEGVIGGQNGFGITAAEVDGAGITGVDAAAGGKRRDRDRLSRARGGGGGETGDAQKVRRSRGREVHGVGEGVGGLAVDEVAVLVHRVAVPVLDVRANLEGVGSGGGLGGEGDRELVVVRAGNDGDGDAADGTVGACEGDLRGGEGRGVDLLVERQLKSTQARGAGNCAAETGGGDARAAGVGDGGGRVHDAAGGDEAREIGVGCGVVKDRVDDLLHRPGGVSGLDQRDRTGHHGCGHRGAAHGAVAAGRGAVDVDPGCSQLHGADAVVR